MPSDPSGTHPSGVLVRPAPDFFDDNLYTGSFFVNHSVPTVTQHYITVALFNNDNLGRRLKVYGCTAAEDGGGGFGMYFVHAIVGTLYQNCSPIDPTIGAPSQQIYTQDVTVASNAPNPFNTGPFLNLIGGNGFDAGTFLSHFPLFIVPVGYSLVATNNVTGTDLGFGFWYQIANE